jgi:hypothetical protein
MIGDFTFIYTSPPAIMLGEARNLDPDFVRIIWTELWILAMMNDQAGMESYAMGMMSTHKARGSAVRDLCAHFTIACGIDIDIESDEATEAMFNLMENKI